MFPMRTRMRGARSPQIGADTIDGRSGGDPQDPGPITAIAWSPGPAFPALELWCFLGKAGAAFRQIDADTPRLWLSMVDEEDGFVPPENELPASAATRAALKSYAAERRWAVSQLPSVAGDWSVQVMRPGPGPDLTPSMKIAPGVYTVFQQEVSATAPMAWVWVPDTGDGREIWLMYLPLEPQGLRIVGMPSEGESDPYPATQLRFDRDDANPQPDADWSLAALPYAIAAFKAYALDTLNCPAQDASELVVHDYRVDDS